MTNWETIKDGKSIKLDQIYAVAMEKLDPTMGSQIPVSYRIDITSNFYIADGNDSHTRCGWAYACVDIWTSSYR